MRTSQLVRQLLQSGTGKTGIGFLVFMVLVSLYVLAAFPRDFGSRIWSNPAEWADNPKAVPPVWTALLPGNDAVEHRVLDLVQTDRGSFAGDSRVADYQAVWEHAASQPPTFLAFRLGKTIFHDRPPQLSVFLRRPDGKEVTLFRDVVRGPRGDETAPYTRFEETDFRVLVSGQPSVADTVADFVEEEFGAPRPDPSRVGLVQEAAFGVPVDGPPGTFRSLAGTYRVTVRVISGREDTVGGMTFVAGGTVFGLMGTDALGRDLAQGLLFGVPVALFIGLGAAILTVLIGASLGIASGYMGGVTDMVIQRAADIVANIPVLPLLIFLVFVLGSKLFLIILVLVAFSWPGLTILLRSMVLQIRSGQLVEAAVTLGASPWRIMARHIFPQTAPFVFAQLVFMVPGAILAEAALSFLGLGDPSIPTWGQILEQGFRTGGVYVGYWWWVVPPGLLIVFTAVTFILLALGMEQVVNPRLRSATL